MANNLLSKAERDEARRAIVFNKTNKVWNDYLFNSRSKIGTITYLIKFAHNLFCKDSYKMLSFSQWELFYFRSGEKRKELIKNNLTNEELKKIDWYYGRTLDDIYQISVEFKKALDENGFTIGSKMAYNYCYIRIIDEAYIGYIREYNALINLKKRYKNYTFYFADDMDDTELGIDIIVEKNRKVIGGFQVKSDWYRDSKELHNKEAKEINSRKFKRCKMKKGFIPKYLYVSDDGNINEPYPNLYFH